MNKMKVGIIGTGNISSAYFKTAKLVDSYELVACADLNVELAKAKAAENGVPKGCSVDELLHDPNIELVINLTIPMAHAQVYLKALENGKHVYGEKPLSVTREEGKAVMDLANAKGLRVGSAPDTFLGNGIQTCIELIDSGVIGTPVGATAFMIGRGPEHWHPAPEFYYKLGGGPMFDMGPYYLTALVAMLGPIRQVTGMTRISYPERTILSQPKAGEKIVVDTPTHVTGLLQFESGPIGTIVTSFDAFGGTSLPRIEVYGSEGTLIVPDPNTFGGPIQLRRRDQNEWQEIALKEGFAVNGRGIGVEDMVDAIREGRPHRASGALAFHVLEAMHGFHDASDQGRHYVMQSTCDRPTPVTLRETSPPAEQ
jgi:predicted dehydrogenase